ncbi:hypothetical protein [Streptomyces sp. MNU103]|uniref:hypothetical protein n=1 Tax=Streptomyces sp. MNU103 TaxID=2560024 RepID=UPI001E594659|nr:hypothetical protein [Streptomyces sp. MNU103]
MVVLGAGCSRAPARGRGRLRGGGRRGGGRGGGLLLAVLVVLVRFLLGLLLEVLEQVLQVVVRVAGAGEVAVQVGQELRQRLVVVVPGVAGAVVGEDDPAGGGVVAAVDGDLCGGLPRFAVADGAGAFLVVVAGDQAARAGAVGGQGGHGVVPGEDDQAAAVLLADHQRPELPVGGQGLQDHPDVPPARVAGVGGEVPEGAGLQAEERGAGGGVGGGHGLLLVGAGEGPQEDRRCW